jgi:hypothetical protein
MKVEVIDGITKLTADEGKSLTDNDGTICQIVWLGKGRPQSDFTEIDTPIVVDTTDN